MPTPGNNVIIDPNMPCDECDRDAHELKQCLECGAFLCPNCLPIDSHACVNRGDEFNEDVLMGSLEAQSVEDLVDETDARLDAEALLDLEDSVDPPE